MRPVTLALSFLSVFMFWSADAPAWGSRGHRTVARIASKHLCPQAAQGVAQLLSSGESLADASTWADEVRGEPEYRALTPWHYVDMPLGTVYTGPTSPRGDVVTAIREQIQRLTQSHLEWSERSAALRMLVHFVGDIHQPLHAGQAIDRGANLVRVRWLGQETNLHSVWDSGLIYRTSLNEADLAQALEFLPVPTQALPEVWANESSAAAQSLYPRTVDIGDDYYQQHLVTLKTRLWQAGRRLAGVLNIQFGCALDPTP